MDAILHVIPRGLAIGALISAPMGPIGMLVIQRTLSKGRWPAFLTGIGASISDLAYCLLTGFCLSFITGFIDTHQFAIQLIGGAVLACFGVYLFRKDPSPALKVAQVAASSSWSDVVTGFLLTFSNPLILFFIIGLFARFNFILPEYRVHHYIVAYLTILGGALGWWYLVTMVVSHLRRRVTARSLSIINKIIGSLLILMAVAGVVMAVYEKFC